MKLKNSNCDESIIKTNGKKKCKTRTHALGRYVTKAFQMLRRKHLPKQDA